jgi:glucan phosphoethanolaminetransferase (alkaline phosphatase superfamily)
VKHDIINFERMMLLFDFLYYSIFKFYSGFRDKGAQSSAAGIIGGFQLINVLTLLILIEVAVSRMLVSKALAIILFLFFQITTYVRYIYKDNNSIEVIEKKWLSRKESTQNKILKVLWLYGISSITIFLGLAIYLGSHR